MGVTEVEQKPAPLYLRSGVSDLVTQLQTGTEGRQQVVTQTAADVPVAKMLLHVRLVLHALSEHRDGTRFITAIAHHV